VRLDITAARPLYLQLRDTLLRRIQAGDYGAHQRLPSERKLSEQFQVSRITVRQALAELAQNGHVYTRVGKGTYVSDPSLHKPLGSLFGFSESVLQHGRTPTSKILEASLAPAPTDLADRLQVAPGEPLVRLHRLRLADDVPVALELTHLPHAACPGLIQRMTHDASLYAILEQAYGLRMAFAEITLGAALTDEDESRLLGLSPSSAVLRSEQTSFVQDGRPMEYTQATYRGDGYHFNAALFRARSPLYEPDMRDLRPANGLAARSAMRLRP
jgi:GntR family transcriptional regulator